MIHMTSKELEKIIDYLSETEIDISRDEGFNENAKAIIKTMGILTKRKKNIEAWEKRRQKYERR